MGRTFYTFLFWTPHLLGTKGGTLKRCWTQTSRDAGILSTTHPHLYCTPRALTHAHLRALHMANALPPCSTLLNNAGAGGGSTGAGSGGGTRRFARFHHHTLLGFCLVRCTSCNTIMPYHTAWARAGWLGWAYFLSPVGLALRAPPAALRCACRYRARYRTRVWAFVVGTFWFTCHHTKRPAVVPIHHIWTTCRRPLSRQPRTLHTFIAHFTGRATPAPTLYCCSPPAHPSVTPRRRPTTLLLALPCCDSPPPPGTYQLARAGRGHHATPALLRLLRRTGHGSPGLAAALRATCSDVVALRNGRWRDAAAPPYADAGPRAALAPPVGA